MRSVALTSIQFSSVDITVPTVLHPVVGMQSMSPPPNKGAFGPHLWGWNIRYNCLLKMFFVAFKPPCSSFTSVCFMSFHPWYFPKLFAILHSSFCHFSPVLELYTAAKLFSCLDFILTPVSFIPYCCPLCVIVSLKGKPHLYFCFS